MDIQKPTRGTRVEGVLRGVLGLALLVAAAWALASGGGDPQVFSLGSLAGG